MVSRIYHKLAIFLTFIFLLVPAAYAKDKLQVSVDRNQIHEDDTLQLTVTGNMKLSLSFGSIFNLSSINMPKPDLGNLQDNFDIVNQSQKYNVQTVNSDTKAEISWVYTLAPKRTGSLTIPTIKFKGAESDPIHITVLKGSSPQVAAQNARTFLVASVDKKEVYVQEQVVYTLKLYYLDQLANGNLSDPKPENAIIESAGKQKQYTEMHNHQLYNVIERKYLVFPQKSGTLTLNRQTFSGSILGGGGLGGFSGFGGFSSKPVRARSEAINVKVKPPAAHQGQNWLPAMSLNLSEKWSQTPDKVKVGDSITRTIKIEALGLLGSAFPNIQMQDSPSFNVYPSQPKVESDENPAGVQANWQEDIAMVAVKAGKVTLPEIKLPWWDTVNNVERVATLPARTIEVVNPDGSSAPVTAPQSTQPAQPNNLSESANSNTHSLAKKSPTAPSSSKPSDNKALYAIILILILGWLGTIWYFARRKPQIVEGSPQAQLSKSEEELRKLLQQIRDELKTRNPESLKSIVKWGQGRWPDSSIGSLSQIIDKVNDSDFEQAIGKIENSLYSSHAGAKEQWDVETILRILESQTKGQKNSGTKGNELPTFYPK
jgi:hypothetical protein